jgi:hypothetical protein
MDEPGGVLVRWFNSENDQRTKALLLDAIRIVVKAGMKQENVQENGAKLLRIVERLEGKPADESVDAFELHCKLHPITNKFTHGDRAKLFLRDHPEDKRRTFEQLKRKSEEYNCTRRKTR